MNPTDDFLYLATLRVMRIQLIGAGFCMLAMSASAQFKNRLLDGGNEGANHYPVEPSIAVSFKDPKALVAGSAYGDVFHSSDGGTTWNKSILKSNPGVSEKPILVSDYSGNFYRFLSTYSSEDGQAVSVRSNRIVVQKSKDGGKSWDTGETVVHEPNKYLTRPWAAIDRKGNLYASWSQFDSPISDDPNCKSIIMFSKSSNGNKWSKPVQISMTPGDCKDDDNTLIGGVPSVTNDGKAFVIWSHQGLIILDRSLNGGDTWLTNDIGLIEQPGGWSMSIPGINRCSSMPMVVCDNSKTNFSGALYMIWADQQHGKDDSDIWFMRSFNYGDNWTSPLRINDDGPGRHQFMPSMAVDPVTGHIFIVFYDRRNYEDEQTDVYLAYSTDNGGTFKNVKVSESSFRPTATIPLGNFTGISAYDGTIVPIWTRMDDGKTSVWTTIIKMSDLEQEEPSSKTQKKKK